MSKIIKRAIALIFTAAILLAAAIPVYAGIQPNYSAYEYGDAYKQSNYYEQLLEARSKLTGDHRYDVLLIALSQLGYHEGDCDEDMDGWNLDGSGNFVEYNRLFCKLDESGTGASWGYAWCAAFASWCQYQAGVPADIDCSEVSCHRMINDILKPQDLYRTRASGYTPLPGDLIYFNSSSSSRDSSHVGIVIGVKDGFVYTVEGNAGGVVGRHKYSLGDSYIVGYGALKYEVKEGTDYGVFDLVDDEPKPGKYTVTADSLNVRKTASGSATILGTVKRGDTLDVTEFSDGWGKIDYNGKEGWVSADYLRNESLVIYTLIFKPGEGSMKIKQQRKRPGAELTITSEAPKLEGHSFLGWATEKNGEVAYKPGDKYTADASQNLYAVWKADKVKITFADYDGSVLAQVEFDYGSRVTAPEGLSPARETDGEFAYEFAGWDKELSRYIKRDTTYTATYTSRELTQEEKDAYIAAQATEDIGDNGGCGSTAAVLPVILILGTAYGIVRKKH